MSKHDLDPQPEPQPAASADAPPVIAPEQDAQDPVLARALATLADDERRHRVRAAAELGERHWATLHERILQAAEAGSRAPALGAAPRTPGRAQARRLGLVPALCASAALAAALALVFMPARDPRGPAGVSRAVRAPDTADATGPSPSWLYAGADPFTGLEALDDDALVALHAELTGAAAPGDEGADDDTLLGEGLATSGSESLAFLDGDALASVQRGWLSARDD